MSSSRREFLTFSGLGLVSALAGCSSEREAPGPAGERPNIVLIMADDLGWETLGCYGGESYKTPVLDGLAAQGIRFDHAYSQPLCTPTRIQLMTGKYNFRNWPGFGLMDPEERTFGHLMTDAGYKTCISGKWQLWSYNPPDYEPQYRGLGQRPEDSGFDEWRLWHARHTEEKGSRYANPVILDNGEPVPDTEGKYGPDLYTDYINGFMERHRDEPFFVYYPMALTHGPFNPTPHSEDWESGDRLKSDPKKYFGDMVEYMDFVVGKIVNKLDELGLREKTLVLFYGDNGSPRETASVVNGREVRGGKGQMDDMGTRVPLIANWLGTAPAGTVLDDLIDSTDFLPTIAELGGAEIPPDWEVDGVSFAAQLQGRAGNPKEIILCWHDPRPGASKEAYTKLEIWARTQRYKLYEDGRFFDMQADPDEKNPVPDSALTPEMAGWKPKLQAEIERIPANRRSPHWDPYKGTEWILTSK